MRAASWCRLADFRPTWTGCGSTGEMRSDNFLSSAARLMPTAGVLKNLLDQGVGVDRRSDAVSCRRAGCPRAEIRRRDHHASGQRAIQRRGQPRRRPLLRRGRGCLAEALRHLGPADCPAAGPDRLFHLRQPQRSRCSCRRSSRDQGGHAGANSRCKMKLDPAAIGDRDGRRLQCRMSNPGRYFDNLKLDGVIAPRGWTPNKTNWARPIDRARRSTAIRCGPASPSPISVFEGEREAPR